MSWIQIKVFIYKHGKKIKDHLKIKLKFMVYICIWYNNQGLIKIKIKFKVSILFFEEKYLFIKI